ncbi:MAG: hypothetical protein ACK5PP_02495 [Acidimicrobiales bacterium]
MSGNNNRNAGNSQGGSNRRANRRRKPKRRSVDTTAFWGDPTRLPPGDQTVRIAPEPSAVVRSLGRPPLSGHHNVADHYFTAVYDRAVVLAGALATAGDLIEPDELALELE